MDKNSLFKWVFSALLLAMSVVAKCYLGIPVNFLGNLVKDINLSPAIIMFAGIAIGSINGALVGALTDIISTVLRPMGAYVPWFTLTNALIGLIPSLFYINKNRGDKYSFIKLLIASVVEQTVCSAIINTLLLIKLYNLPTQVGILRAIGSYPAALIYAVVLYYTLNATKKLFGKSFD